jgi:hypothetical protein
MQVAHFLRRPGLSLGKWGRWAIVATKKHPDKARITKALPREKGGGLARGGGEKGVGRRGKNAGPNPTRIPLSDMGIDKHLADEARIEAAVRGLEALNVNVPFLLELMLAHERKLSKMGKTKFEAVKAATLLPRDSVDAFLDFPNMAPSLLTILHNVRLEVLLVAGGGVLCDPEKILSLIVEQIGLKHARPGALKTRRLDVANTRARAELERELAEALMGKGTPEPWAHPIMPTPEEVLARRTHLVDHLRRGMQPKQAAGHEAKKWADELSAGAVAAWEKWRT